MQPGTYDLVGTVYYEIDQQPYQNTFYNGTIEVVEAGGLLSMESVLLITFGIGILVLIVLWIRGQVQNLSKVIFYLLLTDNEEKSYFYGSQLSYVLI